MSQQADHTKPAVAFGVLVLVMAALIGHGVRARATVRPHHVPAAAPSPHVSVGQPPTESSTQDLQSLRRLREERPNRGGRRTGTGKHALPLPGRGPVLVGDPKSASPTAGGWLVSPGER